MLPSLDKMGVYPLKASEAEYPGDPFIKDRRRMDIPNEVWKLILSILGVAQEP